MQVTCAPLAEQADYSRAGLFGLSLLPRVGITRLHATNAARRRGNAHLLGTDDRPSALPLAQGISPTQASLALLAACAIAFVLAQFDLAARNGFWIDEYFSLWASDPDVALGTLIGARILPDTNPPFYFTALALVRLVIDDPRTAFIVLNVAMIVLSALFVYASSRRVGMSATALLAVALFIVSGPVLCYAPEGRVYLAGLCVAFAVSWLAAQAVEHGADRRDLTWFAILGVIAALAHVFAALFAGAFAAGLLIEGLLRRRTDLIRAGLALGVASSAVFGFWLIFALEHMSNIAWLEFTVQAIRDSIWYVRQLAFGHMLIALAVLAFLGWSARRAAMRPHLRVFVIGGALFVLLPILASFITPLINGRYWLIGAPALLVLAAFAPRAELMDASAPTSNGRRALASAAFGAAALLAASAFGFVQAQAFTAAKPVWRSAERVTTLLASCEPGDVHVWENAQLYATASGAPPATFIDAADETTTPAAPGGCPVLAWAEHVRRGDDFIVTASDADLLQMMKIDAPPTSVRIERHASGFVILRGDVP